MWCRCYRTRRRDFRCRADYTGLSSESVFFRYPESTWPTPGKMDGSIAIARTTYGAGSIIVFSPHPELTRIGTPHWKGRMLASAVRAVAPPWFVDTRMQRPVLNSLDDFRAQMVMQNTSKPGGAPCQTRTEGLMVSQGLKDGFRPIEVL